jgi:AraC family transcriptional regulator
MREENALRVMSPMRDMHADQARIGYLVKQAVTLFESNRAVAWRCLRDASTLLGAEPKEPVTDAPMQSAFRPGGLANWQAKRALEYIEANLGSKMALEELANTVALSKSHFSRAFKQRLGTTPMAYVAARRVERAKVMMTCTREGLTGIALACGFADQSHMNRYFRRVVGMSPGLWRRVDGGLQ